MSIPSILQQAHLILAGALAPGDVAVDATVGNGHDTVFLADCVGPDGRVFGFDVQEQALAQAANRMEASLRADRVTLIHGGHEQMDRDIPSSLHGEIGAVAFNLGYLPGSNHTITTQPATTLEALEQACDLLRDDGVITAVLYTGHEGGRAETEAVREWAHALPAEAYRVTVTRPLNQADPPHLLAIERRANG
jgi:tRNA A58 N-methylase Trm61